MNKLLSIILLTVISLPVFAQGTLITGKVTDAGGNTLPGVTILVKGTTSGTTSDIDGNYKINASGNVLVFSYIGFVAQEISIDGRSVINVTLLEDTKLLEEVVVIGYGAVKKKDLTTAVSVVGAQDLKDRPLVSVAQGLAGKVAGTVTSNASGKPGSVPSIRIRGATSIQAGNEPLFVVDGIPTTDISGLNPNDIESMSILKDASAAAIYGAQGANGVIIITTRQGKGKQPSINFSSYYGVTTLRKTIDVLNTKQYRDLMTEINVPLDPTWTKFNNWMDETFGTGTQQSYQLSASGGDEKTRYFVSGGYLNETGLVKPARYDRYTFRVNLDTEVRPWFRVGTSLNAWTVNSKDTPDNASSGRGGVIMSALNTPPFLSVYKNDGSGWFDPNPFQPSWENPVAYMDGPDQKSRDNKLLGNVFGEILFLKDFRFKSRLSIDMTGRQYDYYLDPFRTNYGRQNHGIGRSDKANHLVWTAENTLDYNKKVDDHSIAVLLGNSVQKYDGNGTYIEGTDFPENTDVRTIWAANILNTGGTWQSEWSAVSFFGRVEYNYQSKYYLSATTRRDGSSKLEKKWGTMPSVSAAWRISGEEFMKGLGFINDLKLRGGWGKTGNINGLSDYASLALTGYYRRTPGDTLAGPGTYAISLGNPDLKWETTSQSNIGIDLSMFDSKVTFTFDAYYKKTTDLLVNVQLTSSLPVSTIQTNAGEIANKGLEFSLSTVNLSRRKLKWNTDFNMSFNRNEVLKLEYTPVYYFGRIYSNNQDVSIVKAGLPLGSFYGYVSEGVDPQTGDIKYKDVNNNGIFDPGDRKVIGYGEPDFTFGLTNNLSYKKFNLNVFLQGVYGNEVFNATRIDLEGMFDSKNQSVDVLDRWKQPGDVTDIPRAVGNGNVDNVRNSTRFIEDGSYIRLKSVTLSYLLLDNNEKLKAVKRVSVYVTGQNLVTLTKYSGFDPEVNAYGNSAVSMGIDYGTYPQSRTIVFGVNVEL